MRIGGLGHLAHRLWAGAQDAMSRGMERLATGMRINRAADDAAGLAISQRMQSQAYGYEQAARNGQEGVNLVQVAESGLAGTHDLLQRMRTLAVQSANGTWSQDDRATMQSELDSLIAEVDGIVSRNTFNGRGLLDGSVTDLHVHIGPGAQDGVKLTIGAFDSVSLGLGAGTSAVAPAASVPPTAAPAPTTAPSTTTAPTTTAPTTTTATTAPTTTATATATGPGNGNGKAHGQTKGNGNGTAGTTTPTTTPTTNPTTTPTTPTTTTTPAPTTANSAGSTTSTAPTGSGISVLDQDSAARAIGVIDDAIWLVSKGRSELGATQAVLTRSITVATAGHSDITASMSRIRDADMALEMTRYVRASILGQAASAMHASALKAESNGVLRLLGI